MRYVNSRVKIASLLLAIDSLIGNYRSVYVYFTPARLLFSRCALFHPIIVRQGINIVINSLLRARRENGGKLGVFLFIAIMKSSSLYRMARSTYRKINS